MLTTFLDLAERQRLVARASPSIGHLPMSETSGRVEREFEKHGNAIERLEGKTRPDDEHEKGDFIMAAESNFAEVSATTEQHKRFEPFAGTFKAEVKMWMGPGEPMVSTGVLTSTLVSQPDGAVSCNERLGGMPQYYYRNAA